MPLYYWGRSQRTHIAVSIFTNRSSGLYWDVGALSSLLSAHLYLLGLLFSPTLSPAFGVKKRNRF